MALTFVLPCPVCRDTGWYRESDPAGRGQLERCLKCNPEDPAIELAKQEAHEREVMAAALAVLRKRKSQRS